jgi:hypothetical protein
MLRVSTSLSYLLSWNLEVQSHETFAESGFKQLLDLSLPSI